MIYVLVQAFWFMLPAMFGNMAPIWAKKIPALARLDIPIDGGRTFRGQPLLGRNKTVRGFVAGLIAAGLIGGFQWLMSAWLPWVERLSFVELTGWEYVWLALALGFGALFGDAVESLFKRQLKIKSGEAWFPFDQLDYVLGAFMISAPLVTLSFSEYLAAAAVGVLIHPVATFIGWKLGLKDKPL